jgi:hypothetical protein
VANRASGLLGLKDLDEKMEVEHAATISDCEGARSDVLK